jgi:hypothetical protein
MQVQGQGHQIQAGGQFQGQRKVQENLSVNQLRELKSRGRNNPHWKLFLKIFLQVCILHSAGYIVEFLTQPKRQEKGARSVKITG